MISGTPPPPPPGIVPCYIFLLNSEIYVRNHISFGLHSCDWVHVVWDDEHQATFVSCTLKKNLKWAIRNEKTINLTTAISQIMFLYIIYEQILDNLASFFISRAVCLPLNETKCEKILFNPSKLLTKTKIILSSLILDGVLNCLSFIGTFSRLNYI